MNPINFEIILLFLPKLKNIMDTNQLGEIYKYVEIYLDVSIKYVIVLSLLDV